MSYVSVKIRAIYAQGTSYRPRKTKTYTIYAMNAKY